MHMQQNPKEDSIGENIKWAGLMALLMYILMLVVYAVIGRFSLAVVLGGLIGLAAAMGNLVLLGQACRDAVQIEDPVLAGQKMRSSYMGRMLGLAIAGIAAFLIPGVDGVPCIIPLLFPKIGIMILQTLSQHRDRKM